MSRGETYTTNVATPIRHTEWPGSAPGADARKPRILVVGDAILDCYVHGTVERISPEAPVPVLLEERREWRLGGAAAVCAQCVAFGCDVTFASYTGDDTASHRVIDGLAALGVSCWPTVHVDGWQTPVKTRFMSGGHQVGLRLDRERDNRLQRCEELVDHLLGESRHSDVVLVANYAKGTLDDLAMMALARADEVILDPHSAQEPEMALRATAACPNATEEAALHMADLMMSPGELAWPIGRCRLGTIVRTCGADGLDLIRVGEEDVHIPATERAVFDVTGAGDVVLAALGYCRARGMDWESSARWANVAAGLEVERLGVDPVPLAEVEACLTAT